MSPVDLAGRLRRLAVAEGVDPDDLRTGLMLGAEALDGQGAGTDVLDDLRQLLAQAERCQRLARQPELFEHLTFRLRGIVDSIDVVIAKLEREVAP